jgi:heme exporter protein C
MLDTDAAPLMNLEPLDRAASPAAFFALAGLLVPWFARAAFVLTSVALVIVLLVLPAGQPGDAGRIAFIHVPAAWMSLLTYVLMAGCAAFALANVRLPALLMVALAPTGTMFTLVTLCTGMLWGKPSWGVWWTWDARMTCELILFFVYIGFLALRAMIDDRRRADRFSAVLVVIGMLNLPIIYFALSWWSGTVHLGVAATLGGSAGMSGTMLVGTVLMTVSFWMYANAVVLARVRCLVLESRPDRNVISAERAA